MLGGLVSGAIGLAGGIIGRNQEAKEQRKYAKNAIQWKVADSLAAGIHPLYGLGASTAAYSPTNMVGDSIARAGQDIGGAIDKMRTPTQRLNSYDVKLQQLSLRRGELENMLLESQIARLSQTPVPSPPDPAGDVAVIAGQGDSRLPGGRNLRVAQGVVKPRVNENPHQDWENEYGEASNVVGGYRLLRDGESAVKVWLANEWQKLLRGESNQLIDFRRRSGGRVPRGGGGGSGW